jgi:hypothetical protein
MEKPTQLKLMHVQCYSQLKFIVNGTTDKIESYGYFTEPDGSTWILNIAARLTFKLHEVKPILRPLSDVTPEQWLEVFFAGMDYLKEHYDSFCDYHIHVGNKVAWLFNKNERDKYITNKYRTLFYYNYGIPQFGMDIHLGSAFNQKAAFEKLYSFHADVDNLIDAGLALDINTLNK